MRDRAIRFRRAGFSRRLSVSIGIVGLSAAATWPLVAARAQAPATMQPFTADATPTPTPTRSRRVRRAQPVSTDTSATGSPAEPPVARAVPFDSPGTGPAASSPTSPTSPPSPSPTPRRSRQTPDPAASPDDHPPWMDKVPPSSAPYPSPGELRSGPAAASPRHYPRPGNDAPTDPTPAISDAPLSGTEAPTTVQEPIDTPAKPGRIRPHNPPATPDNSTDASTAGSAAGSPPNGDESTDIRIAPHAPGAPSAPPDEMEYNLASDYFVRGQYAQSASEYERYLGQFPDGSERQAALWYLGESHRLLKHSAQARSSYQQLVIAFQDGEYVGKAALRLASIDYEAKDYKTALPLFQKSANLAREDAVRLLSRYYEAICLEQIGRRDETRQVYGEILSVTKDNPYRDEAHLALASLAVSDKRPNEAFKEYEALSREASKPSVQCESSLKAGLLAKDLGQFDTASALFSRAISLSGANAAVRPEAMIAQLHLLYDTNKYKQLLDSYEVERRSLPDGIQPEALLMAANSERQLGKHNEARGMYDEILTQYPKTPQAAEARYQRIISLYAAGDPNFVKEADDFLLLHNDPVKIDQVRMMKAGTLFQGGDYAGAAVTYAALGDSSSLPARYKAEAAYRLGYCYAQARRPEQTVVAFSKFLSAYPDHPFVAKALVQRAVAFQQLQNYSSALSDFHDVINDHKDAKEREIALEQTALILGRQNDNRGMVDTFRILLREYPKTDAAGMAHYSIGTAAFNDNKDYTTALAEFIAARKSDPKEYGSKASLMAILCEYQLKEKAKLAGEIADYQKEKFQPEVPPTILLWLGAQEYEDKDFASAEAHLASATASSGGKQSSDAWLMLARSRLNLDKWEGALEASQKYLAGISPEPATRAIGLLAQGEAQVGLKKFEEAQKSADETLELQPEGKLNARARLLSSEVSYGQGKFEEAGKGYMSVSVLFGDDNEIAPQALARAAEAFEKAGKADESKKADDELKSRFPGYTEAKVL